MNSLSDIECTIRKIGIEKYVYLLFGHAGAIASGKKKNALYVDQED